MFQQKFKFRSLLSRIMQYFTQQMGRLARLICLASLSYGIGTSSAFAENTCATVKIVIEQEVTLERQAFEATLTVANGLADELKNFQVNVWARKAGNIGYLSLSPEGQLDFFNEGNTAIFFFQPQQSTTAADIAGGGEKVYRFLLIPTQDAALNANGTAYEIGADIQYTIGSSNEMSLSVEPDSIVVKPQPRLTLEYFLPKSVIADDPNTPIVESSEPFDLGLRVVNSGLGAAQNLQVESFQPRLEENDQGLLVDFRILGNEVNGGPASNSLTVNFGRVLPGHAETASWHMLSTLYGRFIDAKATFTHSDELGGSLTSLIDRATVYRLVGKVQANADGIPDFLSVGSGSTGGLVNGAAEVNSDDFAENLQTADFLNLHPSGLQGDGSAGSTQMDNVINFSPYVASVARAGDRLHIELQNAPNQGGTAYSFLRAVDPRRNQYQIASVVRSDGVVLDPENYSLSTEINEDSEGGIDGFNYFIDIFDIGAGGGLDYTVFYGAAVATNKPPVIVPIADLVVRAGDSVQLTIEAFDLNGDTLTLASLGANFPAGATFVDHGDNTATFEWPVASQGTAMLTVLASDGALSATDSIAIHVLSPATLLQDWLALYDLNLDAATLQSDADNDGYATLLEYLLNLNPNAPSVDGLPTVAVEGDHLVLACDILSKVVDLPSTIEVKALVADDSTAVPSAWTELPVDPVVTTSTLPGKMLYQWHDTALLADFSYGRFMRLQVTHIDSNTTVYSPPLGGLRLTAEAYRQTSVGIPFHRSAVALADLVQITEKTDAAGQFQSMRLRLDQAKGAPGRYDPDPVTGLPTHYVEVVSGAAAGERFAIVGSGEDWVVIDAQPQGALLASFDRTANRDQIRIRPCWTVETVMPAATAPLTAHAESSIFADIRDADAWIVLDRAAAATRPARRVIQRFVNASSTYYWAESTGTPEGVVAADVALLPGQASWIQRATADSASWAVTGDVTLFDPVWAVPMPTADTVLEWPFTLTEPKAVALNASGLKGVLRAANSAAERQDELWVWSEQTGFYVRPEKRFYLQANGSNPPVWREVGDAITDQGDYQLEPGKAYTIRRRGE